MKSIIQLFLKEWQDGKDMGILVIRLLFGFLLIYGHGWDKLSYVFSGQEIQFMDPIGIGTHLSFYLALFAEFFCSILLILGLFTRFAAIILTVNFIVIVSFHAFMAGDGFPILEPRFFYLFTYVALIFAGGGKFSIDNMLIKKD